MVEKYAVSPRNPLPSLSAHRPGLKHAPRFEMNDRAIAHTYGPRARWVSDVPPQPEKL